MHTLKIFTVVALGLVMILPAGCKKEELTAFKASGAVNFSAKTTEYTFLGNPSNEYIQEVAVRIIGDTVDYDRHFQVEVVNDTNTTAQPADYSIVDGLVKAGSYTGVLKVKLFNSAKLATSQISLKVKLVNGGDMAAGNTEASTSIIKWSNKVVIPTWTYYRVYFVTVPSTLAYRLIVQTTGLTTITAAQYSAMQASGATALGTKFGDYVKQWNLDHPNDKLKHDDGTQAGQEIAPLYYTKSKYN